MCERAVGINSELKATSLKEERQNMRRGGEGLRIMTSARSPSALGSLGTAAAAWGALKLACCGFGADVIFMTAVFQECGHGWGAHTKKGDVNVEGSSSQAPLFLY